MAARPSTSAPRRAASRRRIRADPERVRQRVRADLGPPTGTQELQLIFESPDRLTLDLPDNVTTSARGTLVLCEDSDQDNYLRGLSRGGQLWDIALNRLTSSAGVPRFNDEFAGSTFSPDSHTLFVNIQASRGMNLAIWGPWARIGV
jgi:uncharacterized protein